MKLFLFVHPTVANKITNIIEAEEGAATITITGCNLI